MLKLVLAFRFFPILAMKKRTPKSKKLLAGLLALALMLPGSFACGGEEGSTSETETRTRVETDFGVAEGGVATGGGGRVSTVGPGASEIRIVAASHGLAYKTKHVTVKAGETLLHFENPQSIPFDVDMEDTNGKPIADMETIAGGYADVPIKNLKPGTYIFYCSVPGDREAGMEGTITVK
jgi:uncharacterized cupredoxin-like copper-binding protein